MKMVFVGLAFAGKTSIVRRCFFGKTLDEIKRVSPTILMDHNIVNLDFIEENVSIWDLGGQEQFRKMHLADSSVFQQVRTIVFVIDISAPKLLKTAVDYIQRFKDSLAKLGSPATKTKMFVLLHKFDSDKQNDLRKNIPSYLNSLASVVGGKVPFLLTSIFDDSVQRAMSAIFFGSYPLEVIKQCFSLKVTGNLLQEFQNEEFFEIIEEFDHDYIFTKINIFATATGRSLGKIVRSLWKDSISGQKSSVMVENKEPIVTLVFRGTTEQTMEIDIDCSSLSSRIKPEFLQSLLEGMLVGIVDSIGGPVEKMPKITKDSFSKGTHKFLLNF